MNILISLDARTVQELWRFDPDGAAPLSLWAAGVVYMIAGAVFFALGNLVFMWARREHAPGEAMFTKIETAVALTLVVLGATAMWMLFSGHLTKLYTP